MKNAIRIGFLVLSAVLGSLFWILNGHYAFRNELIERRNVLSAPLVISVHDTIKKNFYKKTKSADLFNAALYGGVMFAVQHGVSGETTLMAGSTPDAAAELRFVDEFAVLTQSCDDSKCSRDELAYAACSAMADSLNSSHTHFCRPTDTYDDGSFSHWLGIGTVLNKVGDQYFFLPVIEGEAAWNAGMRNMDRLIAVDGTSVGCTPLDNLKSAIRGDYARVRYSGSVQLTVAHQRSWITSESLTLFRTLMGSCTCASSTAVDVDGKTVNWIYLRGFEYDLGHCSARDVARCLDRFKADGVVLDLRGNGGGAVQALEWIVGLFYQEPTDIFKQPILLHDDPAAVLSSRLGKDGQAFMRKSSSDARGDDPACALPLVVIVNRDSASGSEIFAETVKQTRRGVVVGERTRGAVEVATGFELSAGTSFKYRAGLMLAFSEVICPNGAGLEGVGVAPDIPVYITKADVLAGRDPQLEAALAEIGKLMRCK